MPNIDSIKKNINTISQVADSEERSPQKTKEGRLYLVISKADQEGSQAASAVGDKSLRSSMKDVAVLVRNEAKNIRTVPLKDSDRGALLQSLSMSFKLITAKYTEGGIFTRILRQVSHLFHWREYNQTLEAIQDAQKEINQAKLYKSPDTTEVAQDVVSVPEAPVMIYAETSSDKLSDEISIAETINSSDENRGTIAERELTPEEQIYADTFAITDEEEEEEEEAPLNGRGKIIHPNGEIHEGEFLEGMLIEGTITHLNGKIEQGHFEGDLLEGWGKITDIDTGVTVEGNFEDGQLMEKPFSRDDDVTIRE